MSDGLRRAHALYKEVLNRLKPSHRAPNSTSIGAFSKRNARSGPLLVAMTEKDQAMLHPCSTCGQPTTAEICSYCKLMARAKREVPG
jgi:hypothetical protein